MPKAEASPARRRTAAKPADPTEPADMQISVDDGDWFVALEETTDFVNACFYGREGSYKTTGAATMANLPGPGRVLFVNAEGGLKKQPLQKRGIATQNIVVWPPPGTPITHKTLDELHRRIKADLMRDPTSWKGLTFDSVTEIHQAILDFVQNRRVTILKNKGADVDEDFVDIADYGTMSKMFRDIMRKFRDLPCHVVFTALERRDVDKDTGKPQYGPAVTPGLQTDLLGYVDFVLMFKAADEDGPGRALTRANSRYRAKDRFDVLPKVLAEPTFERIMGYLGGTITEDIDPLQTALPKRAAKAQDKKVEDEEDTSSED